MKSDIEDFISKQIKTEYETAKSNKSQEIADFEAVMKNLTDRDRIDSSREVSPLRQAEDAVVLDNSDMTPEEQMVWFRELYKTRINEG